MAQNEGLKSFTSTALIAPYRALKLTGEDVVEHHDGVATSFFVGFSYMPKIDDNVGVRLRNCAGSVEAEAGGAFGAGVQLVVEDGGTLIGLPAVPGDYLVVADSLEAATADGDVVEVLPRAVPVVVTVA